MSQSEAKQSTEGSRRQIQKSVAAGSGAILAGKSLPDTRVNSVVNTVILPAHAQTTPTLYAIGDTGPCGGIVFYITNGGLNGMEAAPIDQGNVPWGCNGIATGATGRLIGAGAANTTTIPGLACSAGGAAELASNYAGGGCTGWFLPSLSELLAMYTQLHLNSLGGFDTVAPYWSSTEIDASEADSVLFAGGGFIGAPKNIVFPVRAARSF